MKKNRKNKNKKIIKNIGGNFVLWILIIIISLTVLQYVTTNAKSVYLSYRDFNIILDSENEKITKGHQCLQRHT